MTKSYEFTGETKILNNEITLKRIRAIRDIGTDVKAGDLGGWIEKESNLSDNAWVCGNSRVYGNALVFDNAEVCDDAWVCGNAWVFEDAEVYGNARVYGDAWVYGNALVYGDARVFGNARVFGEARIAENIHLVMGKVDTNLLNNANPLQTILCRFGLLPVKNKYIFYKKVNILDNGEYASTYNSDYTYRIGFESVEESTAFSAHPCVPGLHVSIPYHVSEGTHLLQVEVDISDVTAIQRGEVICKKLTVLADVSSLII